MDWARALFHSLNHEDLCEAVALGADLTLALLFKYFYDKNSRSANLVEDAPNLTLDHSFPAIVLEAPGQELPYVCISGKVGTDTTPLHSRFDDTVLGVVRHSTFTEHRSRRDNGWWRDATRTIRDTTDSIPFSLDGSKARVMVSQPMTAEYFKESYNVIHDKFQPTQAGVFDKTMDRIFGEITKGFQETEEMVPVGTILLGIGRVYFDSVSKGIVLSGPTGQMENNGAQYIVTNVSKVEVLKSLRRTANVFKGLLWAIGFIGAGIAAHFVYRQVRRLLREMEIQAQIRLLRNQAQERQGQGEGDPVRDPELQRECVICMNAPRTFIVLDCAHFCLCENCAVALPEPKLCPVCRNPVRSLRAVFYP